MNGKRTIPALVMMAMYAASCGNPVYGTPRREMRKRNLYVKPMPKKELREFTIKGHTIMAYSKKDAIKRLRFQGILTKK